MKKRTFGWLLPVLALTLFSPLSAKEYELSSPDGTLTLVVTVGPHVTLHFSGPSGVLVEEAGIGMELEDRLLGGQPKVVSEQYREIREDLHPVVPTISSRVTDHCRQLTLKFRGGYALAFRAYNNGIAYRFESSLGGEVTVVQEQLGITLPGGTRIWYPQEENMVSHYERTYQVLDATGIEPGSFCSLPVLFKYPSGNSVVFTEADLYDYPGMFLQKADGSAFHGLFPHVVSGVVPRRGSEDRNQEITEEDGYIARSNGTRTWPWRVFMVAAEDGDLLTNNLVFQLSRPLELEETGWIRPGLVAWDWWNALNVYGVDFESGINNDTYKYYIDFAAEFGLDYIILDEGWSRSTTDIKACRPEIDVEELVAYGRRKDVGMILWVLWKPLDEDLEGILDLYSRWGVQGIKVDFMQRTDQYMVNYYERVAREAGKRKLLVDFHGAFKPCGLSRAYPNVINSEGLKGLEHVKWSRDITPEHDVTIPFIRMTAGPMDFTPGSMENANEGNFFPRFSRPMSMGTRCHQLAMYVVYEAPLQMLCDLPAHYYRERECTEFIAAMPTTWDETRVLEAQLSDYIVIARREGHTWYLGAMTDAQPRQFTLGTDFLGEGRYRAVIMEDGINAEKYAQDYRRRETELGGGDPLSIRMAGGGGWAAILTPAE
jgi:alpha-glucosidase